MIGGDDVLVGTITEELVRFGEEAGLAVESFSHYVNPATGMAGVRVSKIDVLFVDSHLGVEVGGKLISKIRLLKDRPMMFVLGDEKDDAELAPMLKRAGADGYLDRERFEAQHFARSLGLSRDRRRMRDLDRENEELRNRLQQAEKQLELKNQRLGSLYDTAHQFVDNLSHEFRTPLTVIKEYVELLDGNIMGELNAKQKFAMDVLGHRVEDLSMMVNDMLDISKLEVGLLPVTRRPCNIQRVIRNLEEAMQRRARVSDAKLTLNMSDDLPLTYCDGKQIARIVMNLVVNAMKFMTSPAEVFVEAELDEPFGEVVIRVRDTGPGISKENLAMIFRRFDQADTEIRQSSRGFGLGLSIVKGLTRLNLGHVDVTSEEGKGSTFSFTVPLARPDVILHRYFGWLKEADPLQGVMIFKLTATCESERLRVQLDDSLTQRLGAADAVVTSMQPPPCDGESSETLWIIVAGTDRLSASVVQERLEKMLHDPRLLGVKASLHAHRLVNVADYGSLEFTAMLEEMATAIAVD